MTSARPVRVTVVDDAEIVVQGLARMLEPYADRIEVLGPTTHRGVPEAPVSDIALVDASPGDSPARDLASVLRECRAQRLVAWAWTLDAGSVTAALDRGAAGFLAKRLPAAELVDALERLHDGEQVVTPIPPPLAVDPSRWPGREAGLTARESEIVGHITRGLSNQQIADRAFLSINSVKSYIRSSYRKMGVTSRSRAVLWGIEHGFRRGADAS